jgi:2-polyprenyl-3-methyl-5-hydroxy-6-metoxy-1,4-benzoquinol methylase
MRGMFTRMYDEFGERWATEFDDFLHRMFLDEEELRRALDGYVAFAVEAMRLQKRFERELTYVEKTYEEAARAVYRNREYMMSVYLPGLLLSHYVWPHHYRQKEFFQATFVPTVALAGAASFVEVGVGTGLYSRLLLEHVPEAEGIGYDVSPSSCDYAALQMHRFGCESRFDVVLRDVVRRPPHERTRFLVCVEVLEHLPDPVRLLLILRQMLEPGGKAFVTAALDAPNEDHIYLYRSPDEVLAHLRRAGFALEQYLAAAAYAPKEDEPVPVVAAFVVS